MQRQAFTHYIFNFSSFFQYGCCSPQMPRIFQNPNETQYSNQLPLRLHSNQCKRYLWVLHNHYIVITNQLTNHYYFDNPL